MDGYDIAVTTAFGNETVTKSELKKLGFPDAKGHTGWQILFPQQRPADGPPSAAAQS